MNRFLLTLLLVISLGSCKKEGATEVNIRLQNVSEYDYESILVDTSSGEMNYGDMASGEVSDYQTVSVAYRYAFVKLIIDGETYTVQPIDYVGETNLDPGAYTYQIQAADSGDEFNRLSLIFVED